MPLTQKKKYRAGEVLAVDAVIMCNELSVARAGPAGGHEGSERGADPRGGVRSGEDQRRDTGTDRAR